MTWQRRARGRLTGQEMNGTERDYSAHLELLKKSGLIAWYAYEAIKLRLADRTFYTPDFVVMLADGELEVHEVKGFMRDDAAVKLKVAAEQFPFRFLLCRQEGRGWRTVEV